MALTYICRDVVEGGSGGPPELLTEIYLRGAMEDRNGCRSRWLPSQKEEDLARFAKWFHLVMDRAAPMLTILSHGLPSAEGRSS